MKLLFDFLPILLFFASFRYAEAHKEWSANFANGQLGSLFPGGNVGQDQAPVLLATVVVILATLAQVAWLKLRGKKVGGMLWATLAIVVVMGGATIWFRDDNFIKWKPTIFYWVMGAAFWLGPLLFGKNLLRAMLGKQFEVPAAVWQKLNWAWIAFFVVMGVLNLYVAYSFSLDTWVSYKLFGGIGLMFVFTFAQALYLARFMQDEPAAQAAQTADRPTKS
jgi:intracellular septation protein